MINYDFVNDIAKAMEGTSEKTTSDAVLFPVIGTLNDQLDLRVDGFSRWIPASDYYIWQPRINLYTRPVPTKDDASYSTFANDYRLELFLKPNDRVVCVPIEDGHTYIITGHVKGGLEP